MHSGWGFLTSSEREHRRSWAHGRGVRLHGHQRSQVECLFGCEHLHLLRHLGSQGVMSCGGWGGEGVTSNPRSHALDTDSRGRESFSTSRRSDPHSRDSSLQTQPERRWRNVKRYRARPFDRVARSIVGKQTASVLLPPFVFQRTNRRPSVVPSEKKQLRGSSPVRHNGQS